MEEAAKRKVALKKALTIEERNLESEMKECEAEIQVTLDKLQTRKKEIEELEQTVKFKEVVRIAKAAVSGRRAAAEMLKYGLSTNDQSCIEAARKLLKECEQIDGELSEYFSGPEETYAKVLIKVGGEDGPKVLQAGKAVGHKLAPDGCSDSSRPRGQ